MDTRQEVEVQNTLTGGWTPGFIVIETEHTATGDEVLRLRRQSDGVDLPAPVTVDRVRATRSEASWQ
jgi:hypothetical protein